MEDYYRVLGVRSTASTHEIRRAYRVLARRYHPDVNPGAKTEDLFKRIAEAYAVLSDSERRIVYDRIRASQTRAAAAGASQAAYAYAANASGDAGYTTRARAQQPRSRSTTFERPDSSTTGDSSRSRLPVARQGRGIKASIERLIHRVFRYTPPQVFTVEVIITLPEALRGVRKMVELRTGNEVRSIPVHIPPGSHQGSAIKLRAKKNPHELIVVIIRHTPHPCMSLQTRGMMMEVPITIHEALSGATITVPTLDSRLSIKVPPGTQSGHEVKLPGRGISIPNVPGKRGDLYIRFLVVVPDSPKAPSIAAELERYYTTPVRRRLESFVEEITGKPKG